MKYSEKLRYTGNRNQLFSVKNYVMTDGKANGVRALDIDNGNGLFMTILPDRCCDIYQVRYNGLNINYISSTGVTNPAYFDSRGAEALRSLYLGFLTTCGIGSICSPSEDKVGETEATESFGLHGRISNTPAELFSVEVDEKTRNGEPVIIVKGIMTEARLFGDKYSLTRTIKIHTDKNIFEVSDTVKNTGYQKSPHMILYHLNYGYPFLDEDIEIDVPAEKTIPRNDYAAKDLATWNKFLPPQHGIDEQCYYHTLKKNEKGYSYYSLYNKKEKTFFKVEYDAKPLDWFIQWKMPGEGDYVLGLEPANCNGEGRAKAREDGILKFLDAQESINYHFIFTFKDKK